MTNALIQKYVLQVQQQNKIKHYEQSMVEESNVLPIHII